MSVVTSAVIVVSYAPRDVETMLTEPQLFGRVAGYAQVFRRLNESAAGGGKVLQSDVYAAGLNHIDPEALEDWFQALPWGSCGAAVLVYDVEGDNRTVVTTPGWDREDSW